MSTRKNFNRPRAPRMRDVLPQAVVADSLIFISRIPGIDQATGQIISYDFEQQAQYPA